VNAVRRPTPAPADRDGADTHLLSPPGTSLLTVVLRHHSGDTCRRWRDYAERAVRAPNVDLEQPRRSTGKSGRRQTNTSRHQEPSRTRRGRLDDHFVPADGFAFNVPGGTAMTPDPHSLKNESRSLASVSRGFVGPLSQWTS
jgi:hypothetical protein